MFRPLACTLVATAALVSSSLLRGELSEAQKKALFLKQTASSHGKHPSPTPSPHHVSQKSFHGSSHGSLHGKKKSIHNHPSAPPTPHPDSDATAGNPPPHKSDPQSTVVPQHPVIASPVPSLPLPRGATPSAPITIEKSGIESAEGLEPAPTPQVQEGFFSRLFGSHRSYNYLSPSVRAAIDRAPVHRGRWKYIVVHNSGTREGNARVFDIYHFRVRHMKNGLAYHFVIGDGHGSGDGQVEIGHRWTAQLNGGHVASDYLNDIALGICLVGDFNRDQPTKAQIGALQELVSYLRDRVGKSQGHRAIVYAHKEINPRPTDCPGERFPYSWLHATFGNPH